MLDQDSRTVVAVPPAVDRLFGPLPAGERAAWWGCAGVAEYAFDEAASMPRWTLPESTVVLVTDRRVRYAHTAQDGSVTAGELRWTWPQHLCVLPGRRRGEVPQIQLVCGAADGSWPALVLAGGGLRDAAETDRLGNLLRRVIAQYRLDHAVAAGLATPQARMLSRLLIGPEFAHQPGGPAQNVALPGAVAVPGPDGDGGSPLLDRTAEAPAAEPGSATRALSPRRPGLEADAVRAWRSVRAEEALHELTPDAASRASDLAVRLARVLGTADSGTADSGGADSGGAGHGAAAGRPGSHRADRDPGPAAAPEPGGGTGPGAASLWPAPAARRPAGLLPPADPRPMPRTRPAREDGLAALAREVGLSALPVLAGDPPQDDPGHGGGDDGSGGEVAARVDANRRVAARFVAAHSRGRGGTRRAPARGSHRS